MHVSFAVPVDVSPNKRLYLYKLVQILILARILEKYKADSCTTYSRVNVAYRDKRDSR
jgi:hypothetical protein